MRGLDIPRVLVDEVSTKILLAVLRQPRTGVAISRATGVPVAETFCRLKILERKGLVNAVHYVHGDGRAVAVYHTDLRDAYVFVEGSRVKVRFALGNLDRTDAWGQAEALL